MSPNHIMSQLLNPKAKSQKPIAISSFFPYLNPKFLYHVLWQIKTDALSKDPELQTELHEKYEQMLTWAKDYTEPAFVYQLVSDKEAYFVVTIGQKAVDKAHELNENGEYSDYFFWHGFCASLTEALAAKVHAKIRVEFGWEKEEEQTPEQEFKQEYKGKRLSYGYEALPDLNEQKEVLLRLKAEEIGVTATESGMLEPEYSTCAKVIL